MLDVVGVLFQAMITYHLHRHMNPRRNPLLNSILHSRFKLMYLIYKFSKAPAKNYKTISKKFQLSLQPVEN